MLSRTFELRDQWAQQHPALDTSPMELIALLKWVSWAIDYAVSPLYEGASLSTSELELLLPLRHSPEPLIARRLAEYMKVSAAAISKSLARLEKRGFIVRERCPSNRRAVFIYISEAGKEAIDRIFPQQLAIESKLLSGLGPDRERVVEALHLLLDAVERQARR